MKREALHKNIYLDNAASTPVLDEVIQEMIPYLKDHYGNPSSLHTLGREASHAIMNAILSDSVPPEVNIISR